MGVPAVVVCYTRELDMKSPWTLVTITQSLCTDSACISPYLFCKPKATCCILGSADKCHPDPIAAESLSECLAITCTDAAKQLSESDLACTTSASNIKLGYDFTKNIFAFQLTTEKIPNPLYTTIEDIYNEYPTVSTIKQSPANATRHARQILPRNAPHPQPWPWSN